MQKGKGLLQCCKGAIAIERIVTMGLEVSEELGKRAFIRGSHCSCAELTLGDPMNCSTPGFPVLDCLPEFAQTHIR